MKKTKESPTALKRAMLDDLARSGLDKNVAAKLGVAAHGAADLARRLGVTRSDHPGYSIPYFDQRGAKTDFFRARLLPVTSAALGKEVIVDPKPKYVQPTGSAPRLYLSPLQTDPPWAVVAADPEVPVVITEGEKKASAACLRGLPTIGLGGVWSFRSKKRGQLLLPDFATFRWPQRLVYLVFDSDLAVNEQVRLALIALAVELTRLGAEVQVGFVPAGPDGEKRGIDDYLLDGTTEELLDDASLETWAASRELWKLNDEVAFVRDPGAFLDLSTMIPHSRDQLVRTVLPHRKHLVLKPDGTGKLVSTAAEWVEWPLRRTHERLAYEPGGERVIEGNALNTWRGWGVEPKRGDVKPWRKLLEHLFSREPQHLSWFERWVAYPLQHPGTKLYTSVVMHGLLQGTGKSFLGVILARIYGSNFRKIRNRDLESQFNEWAVNKQFVLGEEITGGDKRREADFIKDIITAEHITVNVKHRPTYVVRDCINYYFTSQHADALFLEPTDRRFFVIEAPDQALSREEYDVIDRWKDGDGPAHLFYHLLHDVDCSAFNPRDSAPRTHAKEEMINLSLGDLDQWCQGLRADPDQFLRLHGSVIGRDLFTVAELKHLFDPDDARRTTLLAFGKALRRAGFRRLPATTTAGGTKSLFAVRDRERWARATHADRAAHYDAALVPGSRDAAAAPPKKPRYERH